MVDLDSNPTKLIEIVEIGQAAFDDPGGALTTFSISNDVANTLPSSRRLSLPLTGPGVLNIMGLQSAILSAVIFNASSSWL